MTREEACPLKKFTIPDILFSEKYFSFFFLLICVFFFLLDDDITCLHDDEGFETRNTENSKSFI